MPDVEIQELRLQIEGAAKLADLNLQLKQESKLLADVATELRAGTKNQQQFDAAALIAAHNISDLNVKIKELEGSSRHLNAHGLLQLQYTLDDLVNTSGSWQRHLASISNNIPGVVASLGGGAGLAGGLGLVFTAFVALTPVIAQFWESLTGEHAGLAKEKIKEIVDAAKKAHEDFLKITELPTDYEKLSAEGIAGYFGTGRVAEKAALGAAAGFGRKEVEAGMTEVEMGEISKAAGAVWSQDWVDKQVAASLRLGDQAGAADILARYNAQKEALRTTQAGVEGATRRRMGEALAVQAATPGGGAARGRLHGMAMADPRAFPEAFASHLESLGPQQLEADTEASDAAQKAMDESTTKWKAAKERMAKREQTRKEQEANAEAMNDMGRHTEEQRRHQAEQHERQVARTRQAFEKHKAQIAKGEPVRQAAREIGGYDRSQGGSLTAQDMLQAGQQAVKLAGEGLRMTDAMMLAWQQQYALKQQLIGQLQAMQMRANAMMMGPDQSGRFSQISPMW